MTTSNERVTSTRMRDPLPDPSPSKRSTQKPTPSAPGAAPGGRAADPSQKRAHAAGVSLYFAALFLIYGLHLPYLPVWLDCRGLDPAEIALITALPFFLRLVISPLIAFRSDRTESHRQTIIILSAIALGAAVLLSQTVGLIAIAAAAALLSIAKTSVMPLTETIAVAGVARHRLDYGRMRLWGSLTFIAASFGGGLLIAAAGPPIIIWLITAACGLTVLAAFALPLPTSEAVMDPPDNAPSERSPSAHVGADAEEPAIPAASRASFRAVRALVCSPAFLLLLVATGAVQAAHATYYTFGTIHWLSQGISPTAAGALWAVGVIAEIVLFAFSGPLVAKIGALRLLLAGCTAAVVRWGVMAFDPGFAALLWLQVLHALTFGASHLAAIHHVGHMVPARLQGTGQALHASIGMGVAMGAATLLSGTLYAEWAGGAYVGMSALGVLASLAAIALGLIWDGHTLRLDDGDAKRSQSA